MISENFKIYPVAKGFKCRRYKTTCIINEAIASSLFTARIFDLNRRNEVTTNFYNMCLTEGENASTAETVLKGIDQIQQA